MKYIRSVLQTTTMIALIVVLSAFGVSKNIEIQTDYLLITIDESGQLVSIIDKGTGTDYLAKSQPAPLLSIYSDDLERVDPLKLIRNDESSTLTLHYEDEIEIVVRYVESPSYLTLEVVSISSREKVPYVSWGPYPIDIDGTIGEVVGVARDDEFAIGLQALNIKTTGGRLTNSSGEVPNRKGAASKTDFGCTLNAFSIDRSVDRIVGAWYELETGGKSPKVDQFEKYKDKPVPAIEGETVVGSKIALFGSHAEKVLETIGIIELGEGLPHPIVDGQWIKTHPERSKAYFITTFTEDNFDEILSYVKKAGMNAVYHSHPFLNWGKFDLIPEQFPNGWTGLKSLVDKAHSEGIRVGTHTLTTFITPNDPFVTPIPRDNLSITGSGYLVSDIDASITEIPVNSDKYFNNERFNTMRTVKIGSELIRYRSVSEEAPYVLLDCERGSFGTQATGHKKNQEVGKLLDYPYRVFFPEFDLQKEMAQNMATFFNETGVSQMDFDGHEGAFSTGQGTYAMDDFANRVFDGVKHNLVNGSSRTTHYYWHINHYINWGEPWYAGFRESQSSYRFNNQIFLEENYLPNMLGWFSLTPATSIADIEWMLARGAGYNAGFAFSANPDALRANANTDTLLDLIRIWEKARLAGAFDGHRELLKDLSKEFHLEEVSDTEWNLITYRDYDFLFEKSELQPGQPTYAEWSFNNATKEQPLRIFISLDGEEGDTISDITFELNNYVEIEISEKLIQGQEIVIEDGKLIILGDSGRRIVSQRSIDLPRLVEGKHSIRFDCGIDSGTPKVKVKIRTEGSKEIVDANILEKK